MPPLSKTQVAARIAHSATGKPRGTASPVFWDPPVEEPRPSMCVTFELGYVGPCPRCGMPMTLQEDRHFNDTARLAHCHGGHTFYEREPATKRAGGPGRGHKGPVTA